MIDSNVANIGVEKDFHSTKGMFPDAEGILSRRETQFAKELDRWGPGPLDRVGSGIAEEMVAQLRLRSREFRELGSRLASAFARDGGQVLADAVELARPPALLRDHLAQQLLDAVGKSLPVSIEDWQCIVDSVVKPLLLAHLNYWVIECGSRMAQAGVAGGLPAEVLAGVHTQLIVMHIVNHRRDQTFGPCSWSVVDVGGEELVLGDVGPLCLYGRERRLSSWRASAVPMQAIFLPIGPRRLLVGSHRKRAGIPSSERLNNATFALSQEFVIGRQPRSWFAHRTDFGKRVNELSPERTLGVRVPPAAKVMDPMLAAVKSWVVELVGRHWAVADGPMSTDGASPPRIDGLPRPNVVVRPTALLTSAISAEFSERANDVDGQ